MRRPGIALITGASGGIGRAIAHRLAQDGHRLVLCGRDGVRLAELAAELEAAGGLAHAWPFDLADVAGLDGALEAAQRRFGEIDTLVHAAGDGPVGSLLDASEEDWATTLQVKLLGLIRVTRKLAAGMVERGHGRVVIINGTFAQLPHPAFIVGSTINAAIRGFSKALSADLGQRGVTVNTVNPGITDGELWKQTSDELAAKLSVSPEQLRAQLMQSVPLRRFAHADEVAATVAFLLSADASYLNGATINVDGGACMSA